MIFTWFYVMWYVILLSEVRKYAFNFLGISPLFQNMVKKMMIYSPFPYLLQILPEFRSSLIFNNCRNNHLLVKHDYIFTFILFLNALKSRGKNCSVKSAIIFLNNLYLCFSLISKSYNSSYPKKYETQRADIEIL